MPITDLPGQNGTALTSAYALPDVQPFSYRSAITYQDLLESLRVHYQDTLIPYINGTFPNALAIALAAQTADNAAKIAAALNAIATAQIQITDPAILAVLTNSTLTNSRKWLDNRYYRYDFTPEQFGAVGDGVTDDRAAIQSALDAASVVYAATGVQQRVICSKSYAVLATDYKRDDGSTFGAVSLMLPSGVSLGGTGRITVKTGAYGGGAFYGIVRSKSSGISNSIIRDLTFDGARSVLPASTQCENIALTVKDNVQVLNTRQLNANGVAIAIGGVDGNTFAFNTKILGNTVINSSDIGIQISRFNGTIIDDNFLDGCVGNAIDVYGENGNNTTIGNNFVIANNVIRNCSSVGIFPETVSQGVVANNTIEICNIAGIWLNRINGQPHTIEIHDNIIAYAPKGIIVLGDMQDITIHHNTVRGASQACVQLGDGGNVSGILLESNTLNGVDGTVPRIRVAGAQATNLVTRRNRSRYTDSFTDVLDTATVSQNNIYDTNQTARGYSNGNIPDGGTLSFVVDANTTGKFTLIASSGGARQTIWQGVYTVNDSTLVFAGSFSANNTPSTLIQTVGTDGGRTAQIKFISTGSPVAARWTLERI